MEKFRREKFCDVLLPCFAVADFCEIRVDLDPDLLGILAANASFLVFWCGQNVTVLHAIFLFH